MRLRDFTAHLKQFGISVVEPRRGSHFRCTKPGVRSFQLACHNGPKSELSDVYIKAACKHFSIPQPD